MSDTPNRPGLVAAGIVLVLMGGLGLIFIPNAEAVRAPIPMWVIGPALILMGIGIAVANARHMRKRR